MDASSREAPEIRFDDRVLGHLEVVENMFRRRESFSMTWREGASAGGDRNAVWFDSLPPRFFIIGTHHDYHLFLRSTSRANSCEARQHHATFRPLQHPPPGGSFVPSSRLN